MTARCGSATPEAVDALQSACRQSSEPGESLNAAITLAEAGEVAVVVYDVLRRSVQLPLAGALAAGTHRAAVDTAALAPGVYVVRVTADGSGANPGTGPVVQTVRLTVVR